MPSCGGAFLKWCSLEEERKRQGRSSLIMSSVQRTDLELLVGEQWLEQRLSHFQTHTPGLFLSSLPGALTSFPDIILESQKTATKKGFKQYSKQMCGEFKFKGLCLFRWRVLNVHSRAWFPQKGKDSYLLPMSLTSARKTLELTHFFTGVLWIQHCQFMSLKVNA